MKLLLSGLILVMFTGSAPAYQQFTTYRIAGSDILSVAYVPQAGEDPEAVKLRLIGFGGEAVQITIESDDTLAACAEKLRFIRGSNRDYAEIIVDVSTRTINGVLVRQCSTFYGPSAYR